MCRIEGPVVASIDLVFATDWYMESGEHVAAAVPDAASLVSGDLACQVVPSGPGFPVANNLQLFLSLLDSARDRISITSPYFVPDDSMLRGLLAATARGARPRCSEPAQPRSSLRDEAQVATRNACSVPHPAWSGSPTRHERRWP